VVIACQVLQDLFLKWLPPALAKKAVFLEYALHIVPSRLTATLQGLVDDLDAPSLVVLGYGLCGNGLAGLKARGHTLLLPRVDDCIAVLLGSRQAYRSEFETAPGTYYLSKGWLDSASNPLRQFQKYLEGALDRLHRGSSVSEWLGVDSELYEKDPSGRTFSCFRRRLPGG
jgi:hypothetical protein